MKKPYMISNLKWHFFPIICFLFSFNFIYNECSGSGYASSSVTQVTGNVTPGSSNQQIIVVSVIGNSNGIFSNWQISRCSFTLNNTNNADVTNARLWMNSTNSFSGAAQVGSTINNPSGTINFTVNSGNIGNNDRFLFLTFSISSSSPCSGNSVDAFVPTNGLVITGNNGGNKTPGTNNPSGNRPIFNQVTPSVSISSTGNGSCSGSNITFNAVAVNGGSLPSYQWKVNNINAGTNSSSFTSGTLQNNDQVICILTSNATCVSPLTATSNTINVSSFNTPKPKILPADSLLCTGTIITLKVVDTVSFIGGYPAGTTFDFGFGASTADTLQINGFGTYSAIVTLPAAYGSCSATTNSPNINYIDAPLALLSNDSVKCHGASDASVFAEVLFGTLPLHYKWYNNGVLVRDIVKASSFDTLSNTGAGSYCLVVTDSIAGSQSNLVCASDSSCIDVGGPDAVTINGIITHLACQGINEGAINISPGGGTPPYTFLWSNGQTTEDLSLLPEGTYTVTLTDAHLCEKQQAFTVTTLPDIIPPVLNCPLNIFVNLSNGLCSEVVNYITPSATDNCPGVHTIQTSGLSSGSIFPPGITENTYVATDSAGNTTTCSFFVTITESTPPVITCQSDTFINALPGDCGHVINFSDPVATDNCILDTVIQTTGLPSGSVFPIGNTLNSFVAIDAEGNLSTCSFNVSVADVEFPVISCIPDTQLFNAPGSNGAVFFFSITGSDNCSFTITQTGGLPSGSVFPVGSTVNSFNISDPSGNISSCSFTVNVADNEPPVVLCQNISLLLDTNGTVTILPLMVDGGSSDNTGILSRTVTPETFSCNNIGDNSVVLTVTDNFGNSSSCNAVVTISSSLSANVSPDPIILCSGNSILLSGNPTGGSENYLNHYWSGNNTNLSDTTLSDVTFLANAAGNFSLDYLVTDSHGCTAHDDINILVFPAISGSIAAANVSCNGGHNGTASVSINGGSGIYSYLWSNGSTNSAISGLASGTYSVLVDDAAGCSLNQTVLITEPSVLVLSTTTTNEGCNNANDGTINLMVTGGVEPYNYLWSNSQTTSMISGLAPGNYSVSITDHNGCNKSTSAEIFPLSMALNHFEPIYTGGYNLSCNGNSNGYIDLSVISGLGPFNFQWSNGQSTEDILNLSAGTYTVSVTNSFCTSTASISISQPPPLNLNVSKSNVTCNNASNGTATAVVSGGVPGYTFLWNTTPSNTSAGLINLSPGNYQVTVTDINGCTKTISANITQPTAINVSASVTNVKCKGDNNGMINITVNGGTLPYSYLWNGGNTTEDRTGLKAKSYTVTVTDGNGCTKKSTFSVTEPNATLQIFTNQTNVRCYNGNTGIASVNAIGGVGPYTYSWNTIPIKTTSSINNLYAGVYQCNITDAVGCIKTTTITITQQPLMVLTTSHSNVTFFGGHNGSASVSVNGGSPGYSYQWNTVPLKTTAAVNNLGAGTYTVKVTDSKGCSKTAVVNISQPSPKNNTESSFQPEGRIWIFPNPSQGIVTVEFTDLKDKELTLNLYDIIGNLKFSETLLPATTSKKQIDYDFSRFSKGVYFIHIIGKNFNKTNKIILE